MTKLAKVKGLKELEGKLRKLPGKVRGRTLDAAVRAASKVVAERARTTFVPVDSGALRDSITQIKNTKDSTIENSVFSVSWEKFVWYGGFVELGTSKSPAQPFIRPALEVEENNAVNIIAKTLEKKLK